MQRVPGPGAGYGGNPRFYSLLVFSMAYTSAPTTASGGRKCRDDTRAGMPGRRCPPHGLVGPNAIIQAQEVLTARGGSALCERVFARAGLGEYVDRLPVALVPEEEAARLFRAIVDEFGPGAAAILFEAGERTGAYIVANRIPSPARRLLALLPGSIAVRVLLKAIEKHAWTFAGGGRVRAGYGWQPYLDIAANPIATPGCPWHVAALQRIFRDLAAPGAIVEHSRLGDGTGAVSRFLISRR